jgi:hypothetical protein
MIAPSRGIVVSGKAPEGEDVDIGPWVRSLVASSTKRFHGTTAFLDETKEFSAK